MSLPPPPVKLSKQLPNDKTVCYAHSLRICPICCVDFEYMSIDDEPGEVVDEDRVFVLGEGVNRFMPQWGDQILGAGNTYKIKKDYDKPPKPSPLSSISLHHCTSCELTWLVGIIGEAAAKSHPSHHASSHVYSGTRRSMLVFVDGACASNGATDARAGVGIYFGPA